MVKANELRRGNYVQTNITHRQKQTVQPLIVMVEEIKFLKANVWYAGNDFIATMNASHLFYKDLQPIPLTPKVLERFEFVIEWPTAFLGDMAIRFEDENLIQVYLGGTLVLERLASYINSKICFSRLRVKNCG